MPRNGSDHPSNRQQELRAWLENEVLDGRLKPGDRIDEQEVCARFGVSRTPVREALLQLASLDLIEFRPRYGAIVKQMSVKEIAAMWEVLTSLEGLAAGLAARRMTAGERAALATIHDESEPHVETGSISEYDAANRSFHETIYAGCRNEYLANQTKTIRRRLESYRRYPFKRAGGLERSYTGHQAVVDSINVGDDVAAAEAMREHVAGGLSFLDLVAELPGSNPDAASPERRGKPQNPGPRKQRGREKESARQRQG